MKIDITKIEGYSEMTPEQKVAVLEGYEYEDLKPELEKYKNAVSKANSEAAEWKRKHNAFLSEEEQRKATEAEELTSLREKIAELEQRETIANHKAQYIALGYDVALAEESAKATAEGNFTRVIEIQKKFLEAHDKSLKAELLKKTPTPPAGQGTTTMTKEELKGMSAQERLQYSIDHPEEYKKIYGGN